MGSKSFRNVFVLACTNFKEKLDPAVLRWGRLNEHILFGVLNNQARLRYLLGEKGFKNYRPRHAVFIPKHSNFQSTNNCLSSLGEKEDN